MGAVRFDAEESHVKTFALATILALVTVAPAVSQDDDHGSSSAGTTVDRSKGSGGDSAVGNSGGPTVPGGSLQSEQNLKEAAHAHSRSDRIDLITPDGVYAR